MELTKRSLGIIDKIAIDASGIQGPVNRILKVYDDRDNIGQGPWANAAIQAPRNCSPMGRS